MPGVTRILPEVDFDKDGVQNGYLRLFHSTHASAYGFIPIPIVVIRNGRGPTAFFMSGNYGDEYEGQVALCNLANSLEPADITGRVILLPAANYAAAMAGPASPRSTTSTSTAFPPAIRTAPLPSRSRTTSNTNSCRSRTSSATCTPAAHP